MKEHLRSVLLGKYLCLCLYSMYEICKRNSIGCGLLNRGATFYGLCTCDWHRLDVGKDGIIAVQYMNHELFQCNYENCFMEN